SPRRARTARFDCGRSQWSVPRWYGRRNGGIDFRSFSFPSSAWERTASKLCFESWPKEKRSPLVRCRNDEAELRGLAFPSRAWERGIEEKKRNEGAAERCRLISEEHPRKKEISRMIQQRWWPLACLALLAAGPAAAGADPPVGDKEALALAAK